VPCVVDLAAMRDGIARLGGDPNKVNPLQPRSHRAGDPGAISAGLAHRPGGDARGRRRLINP